MKRAVLIALMLALLALSSALALAGQFVVYPGSKLVPPMSSATEDVYMTHAAYDAVVAFLSQTDPSLRTEISRSIRSLLPSLRTVPASHL
jgi:hypothetical protein